MKTFISSTFADLEAHRLGAAEALERLGQQVGRMEVFGARPEEPATVCFNEIEMCDMFVGIYAHRYGFIPPGTNCSITEQEYAHALKHRKPIFCFFVNEDHPWPPKLIEGEPGKSKLMTFKQKIAERLIRETFTTPEDLAFKVAASLGRYLAERDGNREQDSPYTEELHSAGDFVEMLERAVRFLERLAQTDYNQIFLASTSAYTRELVAVAQVIPPHKQSYRVATFAGLLGSSFNSGKTIIANNVRERPGYFQAILETQSELVVPIISGNAVVGVLNSEGEDLDHYSTDLVKSVESLASGMGATLPLLGWSPGISQNQLPWVRRAPVSSGA